MRFSAAFITLVATQAVGVFSLPSSSAEAECGDLGVADWDTVDLPDDVNRTELRKCRDHPTTLMSDLEERGRTTPQLPIPDPYWETCVPRNSWGCSKGYCWDSCKRTELHYKDAWCWLAYTDGKGDWIKCNKKSDCTGSHMSRAKCGVGKNCKACGCGC